MATSSIEWTDKVWNPTTGCHKVSAGCRSCYAEVMTRRLSAMGQVKYADGFSVVRTHPDELATPYKWRKGTLIFVNSMSDLFHHAVPLDFIQQVFLTMNECSQHRFQVLTKRSERLREVFDQLPWSDNIWMGVSIEDGRVLHRMDDLRASAARLKFLSLEPLIGPLPDLDLAGINWVIVGGESGRQPRPMVETWVEAIRRQCEEQHVPFFFKQWGGTRKRAAGRLLNGRTYDQLPVQP